MEDYDDLDIDLLSDDDDISGMLCSIGSQINIKMMCIIGVLYLIFNSTSFIELIGQTIPGSVNGLTIQPKGVMVSAIFMALAYVIFDIIQKNEYL